MSRAHHTVRPIAAVPAVLLAAMLAVPAAAQEPAGADAVEARPWGGALRQGIDRAITLDERPELAIYADDRALVREALRLELGAGADTALWTGAPDGLDPSSLSLTFEAEGEARVLETVFRPSDAGADAALAGLTGRDIALRTRDGTVHRGRLLAAASGTITLRTGTAAGDGADADEVRAGKGRIVMIAADRVESYRLPVLPPGFRTEPAVTWTVRSERGGARDAAVAYLTGGLGWDAEYVARLAPGADRMSLEARAVVRNGTSRTWEDSRVKLVAGEVGRAERGGPERAMAARALRADAGGGAEQRAVGDFHVYELPRPVTLEAGATVRSLLFRAGEVPVRRTYRVVGGDTRRWPPPRPMDSPGFGTDRVEGHASVVLALANREASGLGRALPAGRVRVYRRDEDGGLLLAGADRIGDTPAGDSLRLEIARAFDVVGERSVTDFRRPSTRSLEEDVRVELRNAKEEAVTVQVVESLARWTEWEVLEPRVDGERVEPERLGAGRVLWRVRVPAGGTAEVTYTARYTWTAENER